MKHLKSLAIIPALIGLLLCMVTSASVAGGELGCETAPAGSSLAAQIVWPDQQFR